MKKILATVTLISSLLLSCGSKPKEGSNDVIKVGVIEPLTGDYAQYGTSIKEGIELRINEINDNGGINGKKIEVSYVDSKGDIQEAVNIFKQMASSGVQFVFAEAISSNSLAVAEMAQKAKIPMITPAGTAKDITKDKDYVFRTTFIDPYQGEILAHYLKKEGIKKTAILVNNSSDYSVGVSTKFIETAKELGIEIVQENYTSNDTDFKTILTKIKNQDVENVVLPDYYNTIGLILSQAEEIGLKAQFYGADGWDGIQKDFARLAEGAIYTSQFTVEEDTKEVKEFFEKYKAKYSKNPSIFSALGYDSVLVFEAAVKKGKSDMREALKETDLDLLTGHIKFDESRNPKKKVKFILVKDGKQTLKEVFGE